MAIYRGEGGVTDVEAAPGDTEFAGGIIVEEDALVKGNLTVEGEIYGDGSNLTGIPSVENTYTKEEVDASQDAQDVVIATKVNDAPIDGILYGRENGEWEKFTVGDNVYTKAEINEQQNLQNEAIEKNAEDIVWTADGKDTKFEGDGSDDSQAWVVNGEKQAKIIQKSDGQTYFTGDGATFFGTESDLPVNIFVGGTNQLAVAKDSVYSFQPVTAPSFIGDGSKLTNIPTSANTYTKTEIDSQQEAQDEVIGVNTGNISFNTMNIATNKASISTTNAMVASNTAQIATNTADIASLSGAIVYKGNINVSATDAPAGADSGDMYVNDYNALEPDTSYPVTGWGSITSVVYADRVIRTDTDWEILPVSGGGSVPTDVYTKAQIDEQQGIQDSNISSNTTAIGTLSGQVGQNSEDIAELQDSIFFSSAYSADYPSAPNRDPENGNMYLQKFALFTYSYADATQIFASKTDESGNVRQFTAIQPGDSIVLNEVDSPNYGRYELVTVEDVSDSYVVMNVIPKKGLGTVITGVKVAFQAFPKPDSAGIWTETGDTITYSSIGNTTVLANANSGQYATYQVDNADQKYSMQIRPDQSNSFVIRNETSGQNSMSIATDGAVSTTQDLTVNGNVTATKFIGDGSELTNLPGGAGGVPEAPIDGKEYARKDAAWVEVTGGDAVAFKGYLSDNQAVTSSAWTKVILNTASIDTDSALSDGKFQPSVAGYYQVNGSFYQACTPTSTQTSAALYKNGIRESVGSIVDSDKSYSSVVSDVIYLNGTTDYLELWGLVVSTGSCGISSGSDITFLSAALVTGGTGTGGGSYTPEKMVWKDVTAERTLSTVYTNTNDVPLEVIIGATSPSSNSWAKLLVDDVEMGRLGQLGSSTDAVLLTQSVTVPSGSTYELRERGTPDIQLNSWNEARIPVAVGTGGDVQEAVVTTARLTTNQIVTPNVYALIKLDDAEHDDNSYYDTATGRFNPKVKGYYQVNQSVQAKDTTAVGTTSIARIIKNSDSNFVYDGSYIRSTGSNQNANPTSTGSHIIYMNGDDDYLELWGRNSEGSEILAVYRNTSFSAHLITGQSSGGSGGGSSSYTPEKMVWVDESTSRVSNTDYVNTADVPIYVQLYVTNSATTNNYMKFLIDGLEMGNIGQTSSTGVQKATGMFVVPSGSTYQATTVAGTTIVDWHEARMPVAVATGGKTIAFRGELSVNQTMTLGVANKINLDITTIDTDTALVDGTFKPSVAGYYQVNGAIGAYCVPASDNTTASLYKNGLLYTNGSQVAMAGTNSARSVVSDVIYLDGKDDYLELYGVVTTTGTAAVDSYSASTFLSAVLVSGGSASADSIWTESGNDLFYVNNDTGLYINTSNSDATEVIGYNGTEVKEVWLRNTAISPSTGYGVLNDGSLVLRNATDVNAMTIQPNGQVYIDTNLTFPNIPMGNTAPPNAFIDVNGTLCHTAFTTYSTQDVDKMLAIKDKLIEKLSARLDELEKKVN